MLLIPYKVSDIETETRETKQNKIKYGACLYGVLQSKEAIIVQCINKEWYSLQKKKTTNFKNLDLPKKNLTQL